MKQSIKNITTLAFLTLPALVFGQNTGIGDQEITITKEKQVQLKKANRVFEKIQVEKNTTEAKKMSYEFFEKKPNGIEQTDFKPTVVSPVDTKKNRNDQTTGYKNYVKAGVGNYGRLFAETYINSDQDEDLVYSIYGLHNGTSRGPIEGQNSAINIDNIVLSGKYHASNFELKSDVGFESRNYRFFGYDTLNYELTKTDLKQRLNMFNFGVGFENTNPKPIVDFGVNTRLRTLNDFYDAEEIDWASAAHAYFPIIEKHVTAMVNAESYITQRSDNYFDNPVRKRNLFRVEPSFNIDYSQFNVKVGFKAVNEYDQIKGINLTKGFPTATVTYKTRDLLYFFAGYDGDIIRNTLRSMLDENPWLMPQVDLENTTKNQEIYIGSRAELFKGFGYNFKASYGKFSNLYFFNTFEGDPKTRMFKIEYDPNLTDFVNIATELKYEPIEIWRTNLKFNYWYYETINFEHPYHRPSFEGRLGNTFVVSDKIVSNIDFYYIGSRYARDPFIVEDIKLKGIADLNAEFTYLFSNQFSAFVKLNNILGQNYQRYLNYPQMGLNFLVGLNVSL